jgi:hypothetical protein
MKSLKKVLVFRNRSTASERFQLTVGEIFNSNQELGFQDNMMLWATRCSSLRDENATMDWSFPYQIEEIRADKTKRLKEYNNNAGWVTGVFEFLGKEFQMLHGMDATRKMRRLRNIQQVLPEEDGPV